VGDQCLVGAEVANGIRAYSDCSPSTGPVDSGPPKKQVPASGPFGFAVSHCA
jgi:hypothetical protein